MQLSIIVSTRNRAHGIVACLDSIAEAAARAGALGVELIVVNNGSTDGTATVLEAWAAKASGLQVQLLFEPVPGLSRAHNRGLRAARGALLAFTDDDCRYDPNYIADLLRHDAADRGPVLRGGRIELGDPADLPITINTTGHTQRWSLAQGSARRQCLSGHIHGCNMTFRRTLVDRIGYFDEDFGRGGIINSGNDTDFIYRAYLSGAALEYVPDMLVHHHHGRRTAAQGQSIFRTYMIANGALAARYALRHPKLCLPAWWDAKAALREWLTGANTFMPDIGFSHRDKTLCAARGAGRYVLSRLRRRASPLREAGKGWRTALRLPVIRGGG